MQHPTIPAGGRARDRHGLLGSTNAGASLDGASAQGAEGGDSVDGEGIEHEEGTESGDEEGKEEEEEESDENWGDAAGLGPGAPG